jgi:hypothetical protein
VYEKAETFNVGHDVVDKLDLSSLNQDNCGVLDVAVSDLKALLRNKKVLPETKDSIRKDLAWAKRNDLDYIQYYCF